MRPNHSRVHFSRIFKIMIPHGIQLMFSGSSIRTKLILVVMGVTCGILFLAVISQSILHYMQMREQISQQNVRTASIVGQNVLIASRFANNEFIQSIFQTLADQSNIKALCFYSAGGQLLHGLNALDGECAAHREEIKKSSSFYTLDTMEPIYHDNQNVGHMYIQYNMAPAHINFMRNELITLVPILLSIILAYIMANAMQRFITGPIEDLADSLETITETQTYDIELQTHSNDELGKLVGAFNNLIHSIKVHEQQILEVNRELEGANKSKDHFLANMSHELRTPLNSIIGHIRIMMQEPDLSRDHKATLSIVNKSSMALLEIVNDVLDISKIEAGKIVLLHKPFNIAGLLYSALDQITPLANEKGLEIRSNEHDLPLLNLVGDQFRLARILLNLLSNAVKYTMEGHIEVKVYLRQISDSRVEFLCKVKDTGIGIPENKLDYIFDKFTQAEDTAERSFGGTGLGHKLVTLMGGEISVQSTLNKGSCFTVSVPFEAAPYDDQVSICAEEEIIFGEYDHVVRTDIGEAKILVAEDQEFNQLLIIKMLKRLGAQHIILSDNGAEVFESFKRERPDIVLMDCHMPIMDGYAATIAIREYEKKHGYEERVPIIALTADAMAGVREAVLEAGMDEYISKPIEEGLFRRFLENWFILNIQNNSGTSMVQEIETIEEEVPPADLSIFHGYTDGDIEVQRELIEVFYNKTSSDLDLLKKNITGGENKEWSEAAHTLKGSAGYIGASKLRDLCDQGQSLLIATRNQRKELFDEIAHEHTQICEYLKSQNLL